MHIMVQYLHSEINYFHHLKPLKRYSILHTSHAPAAPERQKTPFTGKTKLENTEVLYPRANSARRKQHGGGCVETLRAKRTTETKASWVKSDIFVGLKVTAW